jgi:hypothetical protein
MCVCVRVCVCWKAQKFAKRFNIDYDRSKTAEECGIFQLCGQHHNK